MEAGSISRVEELLARGIVTKICLKKEECEHKETTHELVKDDIME